MRVRPIVGNALPAWAVPTPRLQSETSKPAVHALGRRRALPRSAQPFSPLAREVGGEGTYPVGWNQCRRMVLPLRSGLQVGEEGFADEASTLKHDEGVGYATSTTGVEMPGRIAAMADEPGLSDERVEKKGRVRHRLSAMQVQQQALIRRLRTLEARRDWRGVLAAMVRESESSDTQQYIILRSSSHIIHNTQPRVELEDTRHRLASVWARTAWRHSGILLVAPTTS